MWRNTPVAYIQVLSTEKECVGIKTINSHSLNSFFFFQSNFYAQHGTQTQDQRSHALPTEPIRCHTLNSFLQIYRDIYRERYIDICIYEHTEIKQNIIVFCH